MRVLKYNSFGVRMRRYIFFGLEKVLCLVIYHKNPFMEIWLCSFKLANPRNNEKLWFNSLQSRLSISVGLQNFKTPWYILPNPPHHLCYGDSFEWITVVFLRSSTLPFFARLTGICQKIQMLRPWKHHVTPRGRKLFGWAVQDSLWTWTCLGVWGGFPCEELKVFTYLRYFVKYNQNICFKKYGFTSQLPFFFFNLFLKRSC